MLIGTVFYCCDLFLLVLNAGTEVEAEILTEIGREMAETDTVTVRIGIVTTENGHEMVGTDIVIVRIGIVKIENGREMGGTGIVTVKTEIATTAGSIRAMTDTETEVIVTVTAVIGTRMVVNGWKMRLTSHKSALIKTEIMTMVSTVNSSDSTLRTEAEVC